MLIEIFRDKSVVTVSKKVSSFSDGKFRNVMIIARAIHAILSIMAI